MPSAEMVIDEPQAASTTEIDDLLSQADAIMEDITASIAPEPGAPPAEGTATEPVEGVDAAQSIRQIADEIAAPTESADADAIATILHPEQETPAQPADPHGPKQAPKEWLDEAGQADAITDELPPIPEDLQEARIADTVAAADAAVNAAKTGGLLGRLVKGILRIPITILILLDLPFAGLSLQLKSMIGMAAIATILVAIGTWIVGGRVNAH